MSKQHVDKDARKTRGFLYQIERIGNMLPNPFFLFIILTMVVVAISALTQGLTVTHPSTGADVAVKSLATGDGFRWLLLNMVKNFSGFSPLGAVLMIMLGLGLAEEVGLMSAALRKLVSGVPSYLISAAVVFAGVNGSIGSSGIFVIIPPLGGLIFLSCKKHPLAGVAAGFAGVAGGLGANLLLTSGDALLAGITTSAAKIIDPDALVHPASNWYFMIASTFVLTIVGTLVTEKIVLPRLGTYDIGEADEDIRSRSTSLDIDEIESKALRNAGIAAVAFIALIVFLVAPANAVLRDPVTHTVIPSPFLNSIVPILMLFFATVAIAYGKTTGSIKKLDDIYKHMSTSIRGLAGFIVLCAAAGQFVAAFEWTNLSLYLAVSGADILKASGFLGVPLIVSFVLLATFVNFFIGSASAKWALLAPIFVPMLMQLRFSPAFTQIAYRIGDSITNQISPLEPFMPFIITCFQKYDKKSGLGTVISTMIPFAGMFLVFWILLLVGWSLLGLPLGPGAPLYLP